MQLWRQLGLGSYKSAWLLAAKFRRAMVDPGRGAVEIVGQGPGRTRLAHVRDYSADSLHAFIGIGMRAKPTTYKISIPPEATG